FQRRRFRLRPAVLAILIPGQGHRDLGQSRRANMIALGVGFLFLGGLLIGGIDAIDSHRNTGWFLAQAGAGPPAWIADRIHQGFFHTRNHPISGVEAVGLAGEIGTLWCAAAGLMNLIAVADAAFWRPRPARRKGDLA
ncbi:MAG: DUF6677 family protein, partial [Myxococcota bacterium]